MVVIFFLIIALLIVWAISTEKKSATKITDSRSVSNTSESYRKKSRSNNKSYPPKNTQNEYKRYTPPGATQTTSQPAKQTNKFATTESYPRKVQQINEAKSSYSSENTYSDEAVARAERILQLVKNAEFTAKNCICSNPEKTAFFKIRKMLYDRGKREIILAQVNIGEILKDPKNCPKLDRQTYNSVQCRRVDLLITTRWLEPLLAVEINGSGHDRSKAGKLNDEIKKTVLASAGIACIYIEIPDDNSERLKKLIEQHVEQFFRAKDR